MLSTVNAGDAAGYARLYADDAVIAIYGSGELRGRAAIEQHEVALLRQFPGTRLAFYDVWQTTGRAAIAHYAVSGRTTTGQPMGHEGLLFFRFDASGLITEEHRYLDSLTPMIQLGALRGATARPLPRLPDRLNTHAANASPIEKKNGAIVTQMINELNSRQAAAFLAYLADDVTVDEVMLPQPFVGKSRATEWFEAWSAPPAASVLEIRSIVGVGDAVLIEATVRGTLARPLGPLVGSDRPYLIHRGLVVRLANGKVTRLLAFANGKELAESSGQWPLK
jgi:ketosteroid isomerase-like protein